eukprot:TRINITY_DN2565_c0_g1_i1.p1 TRINITY_DN2565_c0_g1~~TRINITY_DN2565_c0_g1_i1.p1  ORF type:complete len:310 (+),score=88.23 TRINITY_DN2565_c0_g1_i1:25-954(+)
MHQCVVPATGARPLLPRPPPLPPVAHVVAARLPPPPPPPPAAHSSGARKRPRSATPAAARELPVPPSLSSSQSPEPQEPCVRRAPLRNIACEMLALPRNRRGEPRPVPTLAVLAEKAVVAALDQVCDRAGVLPYSLLERVLQHCTPQQLARVDLTGREELAAPLWQRFCETLLPPVTALPSGDTDWRRAYYRGLRAMEAKRMATKSRLKSKYDQEQHTIKSTVVVNIAPPAEKRRKTSGWGSSASSWGQAEHVPRLLKKCYNDLKHAPPRPPTAGFSHTHAVAPTRATANPLPQHTRATATQQRMFPPR